MGKFSEASERTNVGVHPKYRDDDVYVERSNFLNSINLRGNGLYASRTFYKGDVIVEYIGKEITDDDAEKMAEKTKYLFDVKDRKRHIVRVIDSYDDESASAAKYVNTTKTFKDRRRNARFVQYGGKIYLVATKRIYRDREILAYYGPDTDRVIAAK